MTPEELLNQISDGIWINKGGLKVPDDVVQALQQKEDWFDGLNPVVYSKDKGASQLCSKYKCLETSERI
ncbi:hypothetical protein QHH11_09875, partial [Aphanizomenon sp. PH219]|nr:hypothetical protein [Aphanizomenon sp. 202]MDK2459439.1 hypothetical protein [Aphanizomenon sp. PH219]